MKKGEKRPLPGCAQSKKQIRQRYRQTLNGRKREMLEECRYRAKKFGLDFDLTIDDISFPEFCPVLSIPLFFGSTRDKDHSPSIDRLDSAKGYTKDNIRIISFRANRIKNDATLKELIDVTLYLARELTVHPSVSSL